MKLLSSCSSCFVPSVLSVRRAVTEIFGVVKKLSIAMAFLVLIASPSLSLAATYFVSPTGNDGNSGLSDAQAWKSIAKVNSQKFTSGDDIYFKCGGTWSGVILQPNVQGVNEENRTVIGAYYGTGTIGVSGNKPIFDGDNLTIPTKGSYVGLINFASKSYVTVQNIQVQWSGGLGINFNAGSYNIINNCYVSSTYLGGMRFSGTTSYNIAEYNSVTDTGRIRLETGEYPGSISLVGGNPTPAASNCTIRYNYVYTNYGEGIDLLKGTSDNIVEYNTVVNNHSANIYADRAAKRNIIRYNLVYGYSGAPWNSSTGIAVQDEKWSTYAGTEGTKIYGNLVANCNLGISIDAQHPDAILKDTEVYNNTLVDNEKGFKSWEGPYENSYVKNNIIWCTGDRSSCTMGEVPENHSGLTFDYNLWSSEPPASVRGNNDPPYAEPLLAKRTGWNTISLGSLTGKEFSLTSRSPAIGAGTNVGAPYSKLLNLVLVDFCKKEFELSDQNTRSAWDMGAAVSITTTGVRAPSQLQVTVLP
jgi:hypothetical protein